MPARITREVDTDNPYDLFPLPAYWTRAALVGLIALALGFHLWGISQDLPLVIGGDETMFMQPAIHIAATGNLNPGYFGHPGSTIIYPLAVISRVWYAVHHHGPLLRPSLNLQDAFVSHPYGFYLLGRLLTIGFAMFSMLLVYLLGRRVFGSTVALAGAWFFLLVPLAVTHARTVRTDSATVFFTLLSLWLCLRTYDRPTAGNQVLAGAAIGLAISTKYTLTVLVLFLFLIDGLLLWRQFQMGRVGSILPGIGAGLLAVIGSFSISTPYFFLDFSKALKDVRVELRPTHLGADGLSPLGNLIWYLTRAIPETLSWPRALSAASGVALVIWKRQPRPLLLAGFVALFLVGVSLSPLHWARWLLPIGPLLTLFVACALCVVVGHLSARFRIKRSGQWILLLSVLVLFSAYPLHELVLTNIRQANPSTQILAREWLLLHVPAGSRIAEEWYTAPLQQTSFDVLTETSLSSRRSLVDYRHEGYDYLVVSSWMYSRYLAEPERYPVEVVFYHSLFEKGRLLQEFVPSTFRGGPTIRIYALQDSDS
jgi:hypothetical protein